MQIPYQNVMKNYDDDILTTKKKILSLAFYKTLIFEPKQRN